MYQTLTYVEEVEGFINKNKAASATQALNPTAYISEISQTCLSICSVTETRTMHQELALG